MRSQVLLAILVVTCLGSSYPVVAQSGQKPATVGKAVRYGIALAPGDPTPAFTAYDLGGKLIDISYQRSRATVLGFWSSTCVPCRVQSVALQQLFAQHRDAGLQVFGVATDTGSPQLAPTAARAFLEELGGTYPVARSTIEIETAWRGITVLPVTFLVGKDGKLLRRYVGADDAIMKGLLDDVAGYLAGRPLGEQVLPESSPATPAIEAPGGGSPPR